MIESISHVPGEFEASEFSAATDTWKTRRRLGRVSRDNAGNITKELSGEFAFRLYDDLWLSARSHGADGARARAHCRRCGFERLMGGTA